MVPVLQRCAAVPKCPVLTVAPEKVAWGTQASWNHVHVGLKPASRGFATGTPADDFRPGKEGSRK